MAKALFSALRSECCGKSDPTRSRSDPPDDNKDNEDLISQIRLLVIPSLLKSFSVSADNAVNKCDIVIQMQ